MDKEVELILSKLKIVSEEQERGLYLCDKEHSNLLLDYITNLQQENEKWWAIIKDYEMDLHDLCNKNNELEQELQRKDNIINGIKKEINEQLEEYEKGKEKYKNYGNLEDYAKGLRSAYISILDKIKELESGK